MTSSWTLGDIAEVLDLARRPVVLEVLACIHRGDPGLRLLVPAFDPAELADAVDYLAERGAITSPGSATPGITSCGTQFLRELGLI